MAADPTVIETHISRVTLLEDEVFKVKKPVDFGFVDYSTRERRERYCHAEVALNRRWAPGVYLGVVEYEGEPAVHMRRLDDRQTMRHRIDELTPADARRVGEHLGHLHATAPLDPDARQYATAEAVARNALENFDQTREHIGWSVHPDVHRELERRTRSEVLDRLAPLIDRRAGQARTLHGDLRAEHAYLLPDGAIAFLDGVEFDARYRDGDPVNDVAFLYMDLAVRGRRDLADALIDAWFSVTGDDEGRALLPFYCAYRSVVRAKIRGLQGDRFRARRHWLFALGELVEDGPCIVGVGGLPGTGKSTVAHALGELGFEVIRSDVVRKELAGIDPLTPAGEQGYEKGLYSEANKNRVYDACVARAEAVVFAGGRALIDASFSRERWRIQVLDAARSLGVPGRLVWCVAPPEVVRPRLEARRGDPSDANWAVYEAAAPRWETESERTRAHLLHVDTSGTLDQTKANARRLVGRDGKISVERQPCGDQR